MIKYGKRNKKIKKVELHLHLDGSVETNTISKISGIPANELEDKMIAKSKCKNLSEYLTRFDTPLEYIQTKENLNLITNESICH